ncbi:MAG: GH92 family glycosyl hydrolase [Bacteroidales bacterium]|nr:GH92 family glycosyl hydrolase [Bacteroidales bacterium]
MNKRLRFLSLSAPIIVLLSCGTDYTVYVDPFIGTEYTGHTFPGACLPFGMVQPGPQTGNGDWEHCSGYVWSDTLIQGFTQTRLNGTGSTELGDILIMPFSHQQNPDYSSTFDKDSESAAPGYYAVNLTGNKVKAEITCTPRVALHQYDFQGDGRKIYIDFQNGQASNPEMLAGRVISADINFPDEYTVTGSEHISAWAKRELYFAIRFDTPVLERQLIDPEAPRKAPKLILDFGNGGKRIMVKVALSATSVEGALKNLDEELPGWNFSQVKKDARKAWNNELSKFHIDADDNVKISFYTSLYHLLIQPNIISDSGEEPFYSTFSQWDTFRAADPLYAIMWPEKYAQIVNSMISMGEKQGFLPIWALWGDDTYGMISNHSVPAVVDAVLKEIPGVDARRAWNTVRLSLTTNTGLADSRRSRFESKETLENEWNIYDSLGFFPCDRVPRESVSRTLECSYDDWCAARLAEFLGIEDSLFIKRSDYWRNIYDPQTGFFRGRCSDGRWREPFDEYSICHVWTSGGDYTEANAWQYLWHVLQDPEGLSEMMGGKERTVERLDRFFADSTRAAIKGEVVDVTGCIGQYAHGNEPSHHVIYLYTLMDRQDRTAELVREVCDRFYQARPDGLCGNDDCGQMSAWYIFSALGFYPLNPVSGEYVLGAPQLRSARISLPGGKKLLVTADGISGENMYPETITLNGKTVEKTISREDLSKGGELRFKMIPRDCSFH